MKFKYRVKGLVERSFILRGAYFASGDNIDFYISENEIKFIKDHCKNVELVDIEKPIATPNAMLETKETKNEPKGEKNELQYKSTSNASKNKHKAKV